MSKTILIVEDEMMLGELYQVVLTQAGYKTMWAKDGEEGLVMVKEQPDLILLDIMMPKMNGIDVLKHLRADESTKHVAVIVLSNFAQKNITEVAMQLGAKGYILKVSLLPEALITLIENYFENPEAPLTAHPDGLISMEDMPIP